LRQVFLAALFAVSLTACGGGGGSGGTNSAPAVSSGNSNQSAFVGFDFAYDATQNGSVFSDSNGDALTYSVAFNPTNNGLTTNGGIISGTPNVLGDIEATITATDSSNASVSNTFTISVGVDQSAIQSTFSGNIDLTALANYANQTVPDYITRINDGGNPITDAGATLGRVLVYDTLLSTDNTVSCATCHVQSLAFSDPDIVSTGVQGGQTPRHSMRLINTMFSDETRFFWDERAASHEAQESQPIQDHNEMGFSGQNGRPVLVDLITTMEATEYYEELFRFVYFDASITEERIQQALSQFVKSIHSFDSKYDVGRAPQYVRVAASMVYLQLLDR